MRATLLVLTLGLSIAVAGCASSGDSDGSGPKWQVSEAAQKLIEKEGNVTAALRGRDDESQLVCEETSRAGSHMKERFCYTREEYERMHLNHQEGVRTLQRGGARGGG